MKNPLRTEGRPADGPGRARFVLVVVVVLTTAVGARGESPLVRTPVPPPGRQADPAAIARAAAEIDALLADHWKARGVVGNPPASAEVFLRRAYLDLAGRIPTVDEAERFLASREPDRRAALVADLLSRESYVSNFFSFWADILRLKSAFVNTAGVVPAAYEKFLKESLRANEPYDRFVRRLLSAEGYCWEDGAIGYYLRDPQMPLDNMAITARVFLGTRIECAQCHDHPFDRWKQTEFYHLAAYTFGNDSLNEALAAQGAAMRRRVTAIDEEWKRERGAGADAAAAADAKRKARLEALDNRGVAGIVKGPIGQLLSPVGLRNDPARPLRLPAEFKQADGSPGDVMAPATIFGLPAAVSPGDGPTAAFADWVTSPDNPRFTRVIVNRLWKRLFGAALTQPLDDIRDDTVAVAPAVEERLVRLMIDLGYDMRAFLAVVANTRAWQSAVSPEPLDPDRPWNVTGPLLRRMTAEQAWDSLVALASHEPDARDTAREERLDRRIAVSHMVLDAYVGFDGERLLDMAVARLAAERELAGRERVLREEEVVAQRAGDRELQRRIGRQLGDLARERGETHVRDFIMPLLDNLAARKHGTGATATVDPTYTKNGNPRVLGPETWRSLFIPGYGPAPKTPEALAAEERELAAEIDARAARLGIPTQDRDAFRRAFLAARKTWRRAAELESPAPRGHFLRTMGQSDRDFVENANPNAAIPQALALLNGPVIAADGVLAPFSPLSLAISRAAPEARCDAVYLALLARKPTERERSAYAAAVAGGLDETDLAHALLNTKQFLFVQ